MTVATERYIQVVAHAAITIYYQRVPELTETLAEMRCGNSPKRYPIIPSQTENGIIRSWKSRISGRMKANALLAQDGRKIYRDQQIWSTKRQKSATAAFEKTHSTQPRPGWYCPNFRKVCPVHLGNRSSAYSRACSRKQGDKGRKFQRVVFHSISAVNVSMVYDEPQRIKEIPVR